MEECPVCYCSQANCKLFCGHALCKKCVKEWYVKCTDVATCPMCRKHLCFKGMDNLVELWDEEHTDTLFQKIFEEHLEDMFEEGWCDIFFVEELQTRLQDIREIYDEYQISESDIEDMIWDDEEFEEYLEDEEQYLRVFLYWSWFTWQYQILKGVSKHPAHRAKYRKRPSRRDFRDFPDPVVYIMVA